MAGPSGTNQARPSAGMKIQPIEQLELLYPVPDRALRDRHRFGRLRPVDRRSRQRLRGLRPLVDEMVTNHLRRRRLQPRRTGRWGGGAGSGGGPVRRGRRDRRAALRLGQRRLHRRPHPPRVYVGVSTGGGGWGNPHRAATPSRSGSTCATAIVKPRRGGRDLRRRPLRGCPTRCSTRAATAARRAELAAIPRPAIVPTEPNASDWLGAQHARRRHLRGRPAPLSGSIVARGAA